MNWNFMNQQKEDQNKNAPPSDPFANMKAASQQTQNATPSDPFANMKAAIQQSQNQGMGNALQASPFANMQPGNQPISGFGINLPVSKFRENEWNSPTVKFEMPPVKNLNVNNPNAFGANWNIERIPNSIQNMKQAVQDTSNTNVDMQTFGNTASMNMQGNIQNSNFGNLQSSPMQSSQNPFIQAQPSFTPSNTMNQLQSNSMSNTNSFLPSGVMNQSPTPSLQDFAPRYGMNDNQTNTTGMSTQSQMNTYGNQSSTTKPDIKLNLPPGWSIFRKPVADTTQTNQSTAQPSPFTPTSTAMPSASQTPFAAMQQAQQNAMPTTNSANTNTFNNQMQATQQSFPTNTQLNTSNATFGGVQTNPFANMQPQSTGFAQNAMTSNTSSFDQQNTIGPFGQTSVSNMQTPVQTNNACNAFPAASVNQQTNSFSMSNVQSEQPSPVSPSIADPFANMTPSPTAYNTGTSSSMTASMQPISPVQMTMPRPETFRPIETDTKPISDFKQDTIKIDTKQEKNTVDDGALNKSSVFGSTSKFVLGDKSLSVVQMSLYEIIQEQTRKLEENLEEFKIKAKEIYDEDERLLESLDNYKTLCDSLDREEIRLNELEENVDFFEKLLDDFSKKIPKNDGDDELIVCVKEFEKIQDLYIKNVEENKDKNDEILGLVKENYHLCNLIDNKLDLCEKYK